MSYGQLSNDYDWRVKQIIAARQQNVNSALNHTHRLDTRALN